MQGYQYGKQNTSEYFLQIISKVNKHEIIYRFDEITI
jgi:hypothetical protein